MKNIIIRRAINTDIPTLDKLLYQVNNIHNETRPDLFIANKKKYNDEELLRIISNNETPIFVAEENGEVLGYAFCIHKYMPKGGNMTNIKTLYIDDLCIDENARGKGIGKMLYNYVLDYAKQNGFYNISLNVWAENKSAIGFYEKIGLKVQKIGMEKIIAQS